MEMMATSVNSLKLGFLLLIACFSARSAAVEVCAEQWKDKPLIQAISMPASADLVRIESRGLDVIITAGEHQQITFDSPGDYIGPEYIAADLLEVSGVSLSQPLCVYAKYTGTVVNESTNALITIQPTASSIQSQAITNAAFSWNDDDLVSQKTVATSLTNTLLATEALQTAVNDDLFISALYANFHVSDFEAIKAIVAHYDLDTNSQYAANAHFIHAKVGLLTAQVGDVLLKLLQIEEQQQSSPLTPNQQVELALLLSNAYFSLNQLADGEKALENVRSLIEGTGVDPRLKTGYFDNMGHQQLIRYYEGMGQEPLTELQTGLDYQYRALALTAQTGDVAKKISIHGNTAWLHRSAGMYQSALRHYLIALKFSEDYARDINRVYLYRNIATVYLSTGAKDKAKSYLESATALSENLSQYWQIKLQCLASYYHVDQAPSRRVCIESLRELITQKPNNIALKESLLEALSEDGLLALNAGIDSDSTTRVAQIEYLMGQIKSNAVKSKALHYLMVNKFAQGDYASGLELFQQAQQKLKQSSLPVLKIDLLSSLFDTHFHRYSLLENDEIETILLEFIAIGREFSINELGPSWSHRVNHFFTQYIVSLIEQNKIEQAFEWYARSRIFSHVRAQVQNASQISHKSYLTSLSENATALAASNTPTNAKINVDIARDLLSLNQWLPDDDPQLIEIARFNQQRMTNSEGNAFKPPSLQDVQSHLANSEVMLAYFNDGQRYWSFVISPKSLAVEPLGDNQTVNALVSGFVGDLSNPRRNYREHASRLTQLTLPKAINFEATSKLRVLAEGALHRLPFAVLLTPNDSPLIDSMTVTNTRFLTDESNVDSHHYDVDLSIFAAPTITPQSTENTWASSLPDLPWSEFEATELANVFGDSTIKLYTHERANRENLSHVDTRNARILHISTHHFFSPQQPDNVGFTLSTIDNLGQYDPGFVGKEEIAHYRFNNDLVMINGCGSALGNQSAGVAMLGVSNAFLSAGANNVVSTLWPVSDRASATFSIYFYEALKNNASYEVALQMAQARMKRSPRFKHPFYWAGYTLNTAQFNGNANRVATYSFSD